MVVVDTAIVLEEVVVVVVVVILLAVVVIVVVVVVVDVVVFLCELLSASLALYKLRPLNSLTPVGVEVPADVGVDVRY